MYVWNIYIYILCINIYQVYIYLYTERCVSGNTSRQSLRCSCRVLPPLVLRCYGSPLGYYWWKVNQSPPLSKTCNTPPPLQNSRGPWSWCLVKALQNNLWGPKNRLSVLSGSWHEEFALHGVFHGEDEIRTHDPIADDTTFVKVVVRWATTVPGDRSSNRLVVLSSTQSKRLTTLTFAPLAFFGDINRVKKSTTRGGGACCGKGAPSIFWGYLIYLRSLPQVVIAPPPKNGFREKLPLPTVEMQPDEQ